MVGWPVLQKVRKLCQLTCEKLWRNLLLKNHFCVISYDLFCILQSQLMVRIFSQLMVRIEMETFVWSEGVSTGRVEWRSIGTESGDLSVTLSGASQRPTLFAGNSNMKVVSNYWTVQ